MYQEVLQTLTAKKVPYNTARKVASILSREDKTGIINRTEAEQSLIRGILPLLTA